MLAKNIMITNLITANERDVVSSVFEMMRVSKLRMLPIVDKDNHVLGTLSTFHVMQSIVPDYVLSGDLNQISYAPDIGILHSKYEQIKTLPICDVMDKTPLLVHKEDSLLSVAASLSALGKHEYALVVDKANFLLGVISAGDILDTLRDKSGKAREVTHA